MERRRFPRPASFGPALRRRGIGVRASALAVPDDVDWPCVLTYVRSTALQFSGVALFLRGLDSAFAWIAWDKLDAIVAGSGSWVQGCAVFLFFLFMSVRSRVFSPLDNKRPTLRSEKEEISQRRRPAWMPPPIAFPIIWSTIAILRAASSLVVFRAMGSSFVNFPIFAFCLHLCVGDTWNTINNVEKRSGVAALTIFLVLGSVFGATMSYYRAVPMAGYILAPSCAWLSVATVLVCSIWSLNGKEALYPKKA